LDRDRDSNDFRVGDHFERGCLGPQGKSFDATEVKRYFRDRWLIVDALIIAVSVIFVALELSLEQSKMTKNFVSVVQAIFRFLRIFLLIRKVICAHLANFRRKHSRKSRKLDR
jgi:uncharacterized membrane protein YbhN (UPF0104 family)